MVLFWITIGLIMIAVSGLVYVLIKQRRKIIIIHVIVICISSIIVAFTQQMAIVYGTTAGGNPTFLKQYSFSILGIILFILLLVYMIGFIFKVLKYLIKSS